VNEGTPLQLPRLLVDRASGWGGIEGRRWLAGLPATVHRLVELWAIQLHEPLDSHISFVAAATAADGQRLILKVPMLGVTFPYAQANSCRYEAAALAAWNGRGCVRLLEQETDSGAMLLERCEPGTRLADVVSLDEADTVAVDLLQRLWQPSIAGLPDTAKLASVWAERCSTSYASCGEPFEQVLLTDALTIAHELTAVVEPGVLLHGDFHHNNVLAAAREPWLAIDPLPLVGEREYDAVMFLLFRKGGMENPEATWEPAIDSFCDQLNLDAARVKQWLYVRLIADALAFIGQGGDAARLEARQEDMWSARLVHEFL
jgi:streptomycin 6-kinase